MNLLATNVALFGVPAALAAFLILWLIGRRADIQNSHKNGFEADGGSMVFLLRDDRLIDANFSAHTYLETFAKAGSGLPALRRAVVSMFDNAEELIACNAASGKLTSTSRDETMQAVSERLGDSVRLKLKSTVTSDWSGEDIHRMAAQEHELETLRKTTDAAPYLVWREAKDGTPVWVNRAYLNAVKDAFGDKRASVWPLPRLFEKVAAGTTARKSLEIDNEDQPRWYECYSVPLEDDTLVTAFEANSIVRAENQLRDFMQTLSKTFADLTVGLAIFDRERSLQLFNPALQELTTLPADFLIRQPSLSEFLDRLRENRMMPEPKDYKEWRRRITELEAAAENGSYSETWSLPGNLTYRITGRPHPDGAVAFLFEDISADISLTRQFRRELEISQTLLDNMEDATAHFLSGGALVQTNKAYSDLWSTSEAATTAQTMFGEVNVIEACRSWLEATEPTPVWGDFRDFVLDTGDRGEWEATVRMKDGSELLCRFVPTSGGGSQAIFRRVQELEKAQNRYLEVVQ